MYLCYENNPNLQIWKEVKLFYTLHEEKEMGSIYWTAPTQHTLQGFYNAFNSRKITTCDICEL